MSGEERRQCRIFVCLGRLTQAKCCRSGEGMSCKYTAVPTGNLDQKWCHGMWVGKAPMTDEHIIFTENRVSKARSVHCVSREERVRGQRIQEGAALPWNGAAETLKTTMGQGPFWTLACNKSRGEVWSDTWLHWLGRFGCSHGDMPSKIGKVTGRRKDRCRSSRSRSWTSR